MKVIDIHPLDLHDILGRGYTNASLSYGGAIIDGQEYRFTVMVSPVTEYGKDQLRGQRVSD